MKETDLCPTPKDELNNLRWVAEQCFLSLGRTSGAGVGPMLAGNPVPKCPSKRCGQFGFGFWSVRTSSPAKAGPKTDPKQARTTFGQVVLYLLTKTGQQISRQPDPGSGSTDEQTELLLGRLVVSARRHGKAPQISHRLRTTTDRQRNFCVTEKPGGKTRWGNGQ